MALASEAAAGAEARATTTALVATGMATCTAGTATALLAGDLVTATTKGMPSTLIAVAAMGGPLAHRAVAAAGVAAQVAAAVASLPVGAAAVMVK